MDLTVKKATASQLSEIEAIYERARSYMRETGNKTQWSGGYPSREVILSDIENGNLYVITGDGIEAVFAFIRGEDPTYEYIEGEWLDTLPYCAVHRVASAGKTKGMLNAVMNYCFSQCDNIKIDTHEDNRVMQHQLEKYGFSPCGTIYLENGDPRIAYQMKK
jgi:hypothetical protein